VHVSLDITNDYVAVRFCIYACSVNRWISWTFLALFLSLFVQPASSFIWTSSHHVVGSLQNDPKIAWQCYVFEILLQNDYASDARRPRGRRIPYARCCFGGGWLVPTSVRVYPSNSYSPSTMKHRIAFLRKRVRQSSPGRTHHTHISEELSIEDRTWPWNREQRKEKRWDQRHARTILFMCFSDHETIDLPSADQNRPMAAFRRTVPLVASFATDDRIWQRLWCWTVPVSFPS